MENLDADPTNFRGYGENVASLRGNLLETSMRQAPLLHGGAEVEKALLSSKGFPPGAAVQACASRNATEMISCLSDTITNLTGFSSVAHIMADLYGAGDGMNAATLNAIQWAFANPEASRPGGLPSRIDGTTHEEAMAQAEEEAAEAAEEGEAGNGDDDSATGGDNTADNTTTQVYPHAGVRHEQEVSENYDDEGNLISTTTQHEFTHEDGTVTTYTEREDANGETETWDHRTFTPQPDFGEVEEDQQELLDELIEDAREQLPDS